MKKYIQPIYLVLPILLFACGKGSNHAKSGDVDSAVIKHQQDSIELANTPDSIQLKSVSSDMITALKIIDYDFMASRFHPKSGVRFSPYAFVDTINDIRLNGDDFLKYCRPEKSKKFKWGVMDGSGDPILLSVPEYVQTWVYRNDFKNAPIISYNQCKGKGTTINNLEEVYKNVVYVEYYFPGSDKDLDGMDWQALRLVFKKYEGKFYLIAIINDEWTT